MAAEGERILVVEDERGIRDFILHSLESSGYQVETAANGREAEAKFRSCCPDLILLDLGLPDIDGMQLIAFMRENSGVPIVVVSARDQEAEKVQALDLGADDYITKPFGISELMARVRTALRHRGTVHASAPGEDEVFHVKDLVIDMGRHQIWKNGEEIHFTGTEFKSLALLAKHAGKVLTYDFIMRQIWGPHIKNDNQILRVNMANIRRKLGENPVEPRYIVTELGIGYRMLEDGER